MNYKLFLPVILALALVLGVSAVGFINIAETTLSMSGDPGAVNGTQSLNVHNIGSENITGVTLSSANLTGTSTSEKLLNSNIAFIPSSVNIDAGDDQEVFVQLSIPSGQRADTYMGLAKATYNDTNWDGITLIAVVNEVPGFTQSVDSLDLAQGDSGYLSVNVTNTGNDDLSGLTYRITDPLTSGGNTLDVVSSATGSISVPYADSGSFQIHFSPSGSQATGTFTGDVNLSYGSIEHTLPISVTVREPLKSITLSDVQFDESERDMNVTKTVTITNNGDVTLTGVSLTLSGTDVWMTGSVPSSLATGASFDVTLTAYVDESESSGPKDVGDLVFSSVELSKTVDVKINAESMLAFDSVKVSIDDASWDSVDEGQTADDEALPGDKFQVKVKLENLFDDDSDMDMDDVEVSATFYNAGEDGDDIEGDIDVGDIDAGDKSSEEEIDFDDDMIDWNADAGKLLVELEAEGEDDEGGIHRAYFNFTIEVERENKAEIVFSRFDAPSTVQCGGTLVIYADGRNLGEKSEDEAELWITNSALGIEVRESFEIGNYEEDDDDCDAFEDDEDCSVFDYRKSVRIPSNIASGTFTIEGELFRDDGNKKTDEQRIDVKVECSSSSSSSGSSSSGSSSSGSSGGSSSSGSSGGSSSSGSSSGSSSSGSSGGSSSTPSVTAGPEASTTTSSVEVLYSGGTSPSTSPRGVMATSPTMIKDLTAKKGSFTDSDAYLALLSIISVLVIIAVIVLLIFAFTRPVDKV